MERVCVGGDGCITEEGRFEYMAAHIGNVESAAVEETRKVHSWDRPQNPSTRSGNVFLQERIVRYDDCYFNARNSLPGACGVTANYALYFRTRCWRQPLSLSLTRSHFYPEFRR